MNRDDSSTPISFLVRDSQNRDVLCRIFHVGKQRLVMTVVSVKLQLTPSTLDPALEKVVSLLTPDKG